jgi:Tfp pilus assembly protein PilP
MKIIKKSTLLITMMMVLFLSACDNHKHVKDLQKYIAELKENIAKKQTQKPVKTIPTVHASSYNVAQGRSPFSEGEVKSPAGESGHPLQDHPLSMLRLKGTLSEDNQVWAYIMTPDNNLYKAKIGDIIGDHYGRIVHIYSESLEVEEPVSEDSMHSAKRIVTLQLKDES